MLARYDQGELRQAIERAIIAHGEKAADTTARMQNIADRPTELRRTIVDLYADAYTAGTHVAAQEASMPIAGRNAEERFAATLDWSSWEPGDSAAAAKVADGGLHRLMDQTGVFIRDTNKTTVDRLGNILAQGLLEGQGPDAIARVMRDFLENPDRAEIIALTESARALCEAQMEEYKQLGFGEWEWIAHDGACDDCMDKDGQTFGFNDDAPPEHPNCRCGLVGAGSTTETEPA